MMSDTVAARRIASRGLVLIAMGLVALAGI